MVDNLSAGITRVATGLKLPLTIDREAMLRMRIFAERLDPFKNIHEGERCFIIGNGPSLNKIPLDKLIGEYTFAMNRIALIFDKTDWRPTYYTIATVAVNSENVAASARQVIRSGIASFVWWPLLARVVDWPHIPKNIYLIECSEGRTETEAIPPDDWWSWDIGERVSKHGTSMLATMQIAVFMGFNPIYLVGADAHWEPFDYEKDIDPNHFTSAYWEKMALGDREIRVTEEVAHRYTHQCLTAHELAYRVTAPRGINIYNATVGGKLEIYPRVDINDILR